MPLIINGHRGVQPRWQEKHSASSKALQRHEPSPDCLQIAFVNNMPDPALEDTEMQFFELLDAATGDVPVVLKLYALPEVPRGERGRQHVDNFYSDFNILKSTQVDGLIVTGTEPKHQDLRDEPYWESLVELFEWAERHTSSTVLSCLAAHASVLHSDGIGRHSLPDKRFGVFDYAKPVHHELTTGTPNILSIPHSRWNEVREDALTGCGYSLLTKSPELGVDLFVKEKRKSLFVHFQGHPEYSTQTLLKEYRRDVRRFLLGERDTYPSLPNQYFDERSTLLLNQFRVRASADRHEARFDVFPESELKSTLQNIWLSSAQCLYSNWLQILASRKSDRSKLCGLTAAFDRSTEQPHRVNSAMKRIA